ncbi:MAG: ABC transporter permease [Acidimicrobiales bacterium]
MFRRTLKLAWYKRNRYSLTIVAIALSVAFIVSTLLLTTSISDVGEPISDAYDGVATVVSGPEVAEADGPQGATNAPVPATVVSDLSSAGYEAVGFSSPYVQVVGADGTAAGQAQASSNVGEPWLAESALNAFEITDGVAPSQVGEVALDSSTADDAGLVVGDTIGYVTDAGLGQAELVGIASFGGAENDPYVSTMLFDAADPVLAPTQGYEYVLVSAGTSGSAATTAEITDRLPDLVVRSGEVWVSDQIDEINSFLGFFEIFLTAFAVIAVVVGMVIVTNTFTVSLAQRTQELALLRLVGTTRRQLMSQVVIEALLLGVAGTIIGVVVGLLGVNAMGALLDWLGLSIERSDATSPVAIIIGAVVGTGVTLAAAVWPARKATEVAPIEALRSAELEPPSASRRRGIAAAATTIIGVAALIYGMTQGDVLIAGIGIGGLFAALYLGGEFLIRIVARLARPLLGKAGATGTVASRNLERNAGRTSAAASALMIGVSLIAFFTLMAATIGQFIAGDSGEALSADFVVQGIGNQPGPVLGQSVLDDISAVDGVETVVPIFNVAVRPVNEAAIEQVGPGGGAVTVAATELDELNSLFQFNFSAGTLDAVSGTSVIVDQTTADAQLLSVGDSFPVTSAAGEVELEVVAIVEASLPGTPQPGIIGSTDLAQTLGFAGEATTAYIGVDAGAGVDEAALAAAIGLPTIDVLSNGDYIDSLGANLDTILALVYALLAVAVVIALVGIANTVSLAISERVGEIAAIRAAGASIRQIFWSLICEFGLLALVGVLSGLALAWVSALGLFQALSDGQISTPETDVVTGLIIVAAGLAGGAVAAWFPARSASRSDILDILRAE